MRTLLPALFLMLPAVAASAADAPHPAHAKKKTAISLLPPGSQLQGVMLPRYDEQHRLSGVLKARTMTLVSEEMVAGDRVSVEFFNLDRSPRGRIDLLSAMLDQGRGLLRAQEDVTIQADRVHARGHGLVYSFQQGEGFLIGPVATHIQTATRTRMKPSTSSLQSAAAAIASSATLAASPPASDSSPTLPADTASAREIHARAVTTARTNLRAELAAASAATAAASSFLEQSDLLTQESAPAAEPAKPLEVVPGPMDTVISCDGGMYFDAEDGIFVYLKNVRVADPRFSLGGASELKIFLSKKHQDKPANEPADGKTGLALGAKFGDVERIIATGAVRILQKQPEAGKQPVEASGAIFNYHVGTGEIVLTGGYPWVKQGTTFMRAKEPGLSLRIQKNGSFVTEGNWDMGGTLDSQR